MVRAQRAGHRTGFVRAAKLVALAAAVAALTTGCSVQDVFSFGWPDGVTPQAHSIRKLWTYSTMAALTVGAITWAVMFWSIARHRKKATDTDDTPPRQAQYNVPVEVVFTVIPTIIVALLFAFTVNVQSYVDSSAGAPDVRVSVTGFQWNWQFDYPDAKGPTGTPVSTVGTSETIPLLVLPTGKRVEFTQRSNDVIHSFWVPDFLFKRDVFPMPEFNDQDNVWEIERIDREGAFVGRCAELCGAYHSQMNFEVRAISPELFDRWLEVRATVNPATGAAYTAGEALAELNCGKVCSPEAYTTYPFNTKRTERSASQPVSSGS